MSEPASGVKRYFTISMFLIGLVLTLCTVTGLFASVADYVDKINHNLVVLAAFSLVAIIIYSFAFLVVFTLLLIIIIYHFTQNPCVLRKARYLTTVTVFLVIASGIVRAIALIAYKDGLIAECKNLVMGADIKFRWSISALHPSEALSARAAIDWCDNAWHEGLWSTLYAVTTEAMLCFPLSAATRAYFNQLANSPPAPRVRHIIVRAVRTLETDNQQYDETKPQSRHIEKKPRPVTTLFGFDETQINITPWEHPPT